MENEKLGESTTMADDEGGSKSSVSIVSKARFAFHSAAAKAEQVLLDFKSDLKDSDEFREVENSEFEQKAFNESKQSRWKPPSLGTKQEWHERLRNIGKGRKGTEEVVKVESPKMSFPIYDENLYLYNEKISSESKGFETQSLSDGTDANKDIIPPSFVLKQLAIATESERNYKSVKDLLTSSASSSPVRERASLSISAVRSLVLRGKEEKVSSEFSDDKVWAFIQSILDAEGLTPSRKVGFLVENLPSTLTLARDIHGASPESLLVKVSEVIGSFKTLRKMAQFWFRFVAELRTLWLEEQYIPGVPLDELPDLNYCLLYQQLQLMNCCVSRKRRRAIATESLELLMTEADCDADGIPSSVEKITSGSFLYAKTVAGEVVLRLGASHEADNLTMLETGEPVFAPLTQEGPLLTEDLAREAEEFVLRTGSVGAGCSHLLSDMQAFKAANPGCILEDFVRWHSPPDWTEQESGNESDASSAAGDSTSSRGRLSSRMRKEAKPVPAVRQAPLFDEDLAVEGVLTELEEMSPSQLFGQLFRSLLGLGFVIAETKLSTDESILKLFYECKDFVVASYQGDAWIEKIDDLCQVYETVEAIFVRPEDVVKVMKQPEDANSDEPKHRFKKFTQIFNRKNRPRKSTPDEGSPDDTPTRQPFSNFFDSRSSLFSKKPPKPENPPSQATNPCGLDENDWTVV
ncbi:hypothetical protein KSS87_000232 [Heliosperma pusillum]|nr:hypothetical protein KSS87_000232 [Heliosperma pusillum]